MRRSHRPLPRPRALDHQPDGHAVANDLPQPLRRDLRTRLAARNVNEPPPRRHALVRAALCARKLLSRIESSLRPHSRDRSSAAITAGDLPIRMLALMVVAG